MASVVSRIVQGIALGITLSATASSLIAGEDWSTFRGPQGNGVAAAELPSGDGPLALELRWKRSIGSGYSGIALTPELMITAFAAGERDVVAAFDRKTGVERWRHDLAPVYKGHDGSHDGPITTPAVDRGRVFVLGPWGHLAALDASSGKPLWKKHLTDDLGCPKPMYGFGGSPLVVGDLMILQTGGKPGSVAAFDVKTGDVRWRSFQDEAWLQSPVLARIAGRDQILVLGNQTAAGLDPVSGTVLWTHAHEANAAATGAMSASPIAVDGTRILLKHDRGTSRLIEVTAADSGELTATVVLDDRALSKSYSPPTLWDGIVYGYTSRFLGAFDPANGKLLWKSRDPGDGFPIVVGGELVIQGKKGALHLGSARRDGWTETARLQLFDDLSWTPPSYADGAVYARSLGEIARVDLVRADATTLADSPALPATLQSLANQVQLASVEERGAIVDQFLAGRELPLVNGTEVLFLWRGEANDVAVAGDMIGMRREEPMRRIDGTDLWWWRTELDRRARASYVFFVDYEPSVDPAHDRRVTATVLGPDMNWRREEALEMSWFAMPEWPGRAKPAPNDTTHTSTVGTASPRKGRMEKMSVTITPTGEGASMPPYDATLDVWLPPGYDEDTTQRYPVVLVHDSFAKTEGAWPSTLDHIVGLQVKPLIAVFLTRGASTPELPTQVLPEIDRRYRTIPERTARANVGMGWAAFGAAAITFGNPDQFGLLGIQSFYALESQMNSVLEAIGEKTAASTPMQIYLEWGRWDLQSPHEAMDMQASSRQAWNELTQRGWKPIGGEVWDSTDHSSWSNRTELLLTTLFPLDGPPNDSSTLSAWKTDGR